MTLKILLTLIIVNNYLELFFLRQTIIPDDYTFYLLKGNFDDIEKMCLSTGTNFQLACFHNNHFA